MSNRISSEHALRWKPPPPHADVAALLQRAYQAGEQSVRARTRQDIIAHIDPVIRDPAVRTRLTVAILAAPDNATAQQLVLDALRTERARVEADRIDAQSQIGRLDRVSGALLDVAAWMAELPRLEAVDGSLLHRVLPENTMMQTLDEHPLAPEIAQTQSGPSGVFLVQHDWASLISTADVDDGAIRLPFDRCCFEFSISGRRVLAIIASDDGLPYRLVLVIRAKGGWLIPCSYALSEQTITREGEGVDDTLSVLPRLLMAQVRAIAIMLDAEVVVSEAVRAPHIGTGTQTRREDRGALDHHILRLSRRPRAAGVRMAGEARRKRLHFRRGHWRHYPSHKTWIRWCLVGDPSLGFADKDYRL